MVDNGTRIVVKALTPKGRASLLIQKEDEVALREKYKYVCARSLPANVRNFLKTVSVYMPKIGEPEEHQILGFKRMTKYHQHMFYLGVKQAFKDNGCSIKDFEVLFYDA